MNTIAYILVIVGGLNWGLVGISSDLNLVNLIFGSVSWLERLVYILVGLSALWLLVAKMKNKKGSSSVNSGM